ncbi:MAG: hypothetical protein K5739_08310 [Lachnospiraceae bacterium]|nr:hypothetical protein [Lachnospiraceae bacterium]
MSEQRKKAARTAVCSAAITAVGAVATVAAVKKWGLLKIASGVALPFVVKDALQAFEQSKQKTYRYMQEHKAGRHYIKLD